MNQVVLPEDPLTITVSASKLYRISRTTHTEPYFGIKAMYRFDDPDGRYGVMYAGDSPETAFAETILHSNSQTLRAGGFWVPKNRLENRTLVTYAHPEGHDLVLADLTGASLKRLGLNNDVSSGSEYRYTQALSKAIRHRMPHVHGIRYVSRQLNTSYCYALFEESRLMKKFEVLFEDEMLEALCKAFGVTIGED